jgi:hypothetical protein
MLVVSQALDIVRTEPVIIDEPIKCKLDKDETVEE